MSKTHYFITVEQVAYHEAGHAMYYMLRGVIPNQIYVIDKNQGATVVECPDGEWSHITQDFILLSGTVAQHIYAGDFAEMLQAVANGEIPEGAGSDFSKLSENDPEVIAEMMMHLYDLFCTERWILLAAIAQQLIQQKVLDQREIARIVLKLSDIHQSMQRIAKIRKKRIFPEYSKRNRHFLQ